MDDSGNKEFIKRIETDDSVIIIRDDKVELIDKQSISQIKCGEHLDKGSKKQVSYDLFAIHFKPYMMQYCTQDNMLQCLARFPTCCNISKWLCAILQRRFAQSCKINQHTFTHSHLE